jgi:hypothetical protein
MAQVFVSYKRENKEVVHALVQRLRSAGLSVWWDSEIAPDAPWEATIERELEQARAVIVAWSRAAVASENVKAEARRAREQGKLIQVFLEPCDPPLFFGERQGVELTNWSGDANDDRFEAVVAAAKAVSEGRRPPAGSGYTPRKRARAPFWLGVAAALLVVLALVNLDRLRELSCSIGGFACAEDRLTQDREGIEASVSAPNSSGPLVQAGVEQRLEIPAGAAVDFDTGEISQNLTDGSDFVFTGDSTGFAVASTGAPAVIGLALPGPASQATCGTDLARPTISWQIPMANDAGEYQCFVTGDGREGAYTLQRLQARSVVLTYVIWD